MATPNSDLYTAPSGTTKVYIGIAPPDGGGGIPPGSGTPRDATTYLFQPVSRAAVAQRIPGQMVDSRHQEFFGPTPLFVDQLTGWLWDQQGGDIVDATSTRNPTNPTPWASVATPSTGLISGHAPINHSMDVLAAVQWAITNGRWMAFSLRGSAGPRKIATHMASPGLRPVLNVTYSGGGTATLACRVVASLTSMSSASAQMSAADVGLPTSASGSCFIEFERPTAAVTAATMSFWVTEQYWSGSPTDIKLIGVMDPPKRNALITGGGAASAGQFDAGLAADPNVIFVHRYLDGTPQTDFVSTAWISKVDTDFSPHLFGLPTTDTGKLPYTNVGKFVNGNQPGAPSDATQWNLTKVESSYIGEGFVPVAPGLGALRTKLTGHRPLVDGQADSGIMAGMGACQAEMYLPEPLIGLLPHIRWRYKHRFHIDYAPGTYPLSPDNKQQQYIDPVGTTPRRIRYASRSGKWMLGPTHATSAGGFSGTSGMGFGWQMRGIWFVADVNVTGPLDQRLAPGYHLYDYLVRPPTGHRYGSSDYGIGERWGQRGGYGGLMDPDTWYDVEGELKLNTITPGVAPGYIADGELRAWVNGRLVYERTGMLFRSSPTDAAGQVPGGAYSTPIRELGVRSFQWNFFHGGQDWTDMDITSFMSCLVVTKGAFGHIGPPNLTSGAGSGVNIVGNVYTPNRDAGGNVLASDWSALPTMQWLAVGGANNKLSDVREVASYPNSGGADSFTSAFKAWAGMATDSVNKRLLAAGMGGHGDAHMCENGVYEISALKLSCARLINRSALSAAQTWNGTAFVAANGYPNIPTPLSDGRYGSSHTYYSTEYIPPATAQALGYTGNSKGLIYCGQNVLGLINLDDNSYAPPLWWAATDSQSNGVPNSNVMAMLDGTSIYGARVDYGHYKVDLTTTSVSRASSVSCCTLYPSWATASTNLKRFGSVLCKMRERREYMAIAPGSNPTDGCARVRLGDALSDGFNGGNMSAYVDAITLASADGSHTDFNATNLTGSNNSPLGHALSVYDHTDASIWIVGNQLGGSLYKISGLSGNTWTTQKLNVPTIYAETGGTGLNYNSGMLFEPVPGVRCILRMSGAYQPIQILRIA